MGPMWIPQTQKASAHTHITSRPHVIFRLLFLLLSPLVGLMDNVWLSLKGGLKSTSQIEAVCTWPQKLRPQLSIICPPPPACDWGSKGDWISQEPSICSGPIEAYKLFHERWLSQEDYEKEVATRRRGSSWLPMQSSIDLTTPPFLVPTSWKWPRMHLYQHLPGCSRTGAPSD